MKKVILLALLMPYMAFGQIVENFESGNIENWMQSTESVWIADTAACISGVYSLHHSYDNPDSGTDRIGLRIRNLYPSMGIVRWSFLLRHGYDPSSSNNWAVFLMSDSEPGAMSPDGSTNGFAIGVNLTGYDDTLRLWKVKGKAIIPVVNCRINWQTEIGMADAVKVNIERTQEGIWSVSVLRRDGTSFTTITGIDTELFSSEWFGIFYKYSATRDRLLWIDDITIDGTFYEDIEIPVVKNCEVSGKNSLDITLNEQIIDELLVPGNFSVNGGDNKSISIQNKNSLTYTVEFAGDFNNKLLNTLIINKLCDKAGNCSSDIHVPFTPVWADRGDIVISEIMADPFPVISLPGEEYIEITNRTNYSYNLRNWILLCGSQSCFFPEIRINPYEIMIICSSEDTLVFAEFGRAEGLKQFPSMTDRGNIICLSDSSGTLITGVDYSSDWHSDELKSGGGWSLEMIDLQFPFYIEGNWTSSSSRKGGTPGGVNSVARHNPDISFYGVQNVFSDDSINVTITFSEPVFCLTENIKNIDIGGTPIVNVYPADPLFREFLVKPAKPLAAGVIYQCNISRDIKDFAGNDLQTGTFEFGLTEPSVEGDILFNELLFNPLPGDPDYIELFNCSDKVIDASRLQLVSVNDVDGDTSGICVVSGEKRCIKPGSYYAITTSGEKISDRYFSADPENIFETASLPSMSDKEGHLILYNRELEKLDEVYYNENMHYSLLSRFEGVALEKTGPLNKSEDAENWHSALESKGWGTPGAPNSVFPDLPPASDKVVFSSTRITPDGDGFEDNLVIRLSLKGNDNVISATVFDEAGDYIRKIASNLLTGTDATLIWDGTTDDGSLADPGIYIVFITLFDDTGETEKWKKVCTVLR
ncbi:MAG: lamin tail domain-containing protein [Bacteroidales bacterium]|nr:lamin tail domain-containing protein [Bacteroidales bacterium]